jgi:proton-dependent oligopeptide transporter, POT family
MAATLSELRRTHPEGLFVLFFAEMWERFSYYGMRALLVLFLTKHFLWSDDEANNLFGAYTSLVYLTPLLGGLLADKLLGYRKTVILGGVLMMLGHFAMAFVDLDNNHGADPSDRQILFAALALLIIGNGAFKPNISSIVGKLYAEGDKNRDTGFLIFYMGINLGAFLSPLLCGYLGERIGWHWGFGLAGVGMLVGLLNFILGQHRFRRLPPGAAADTPLISDPPDAAQLQRKILGLPLEWAVYLAAILCVGLAWFLVQQFVIIGVLLNVVSASAIAVVVWIGYTRCTKEVRQRLFVALGLTFFSVVFWAFFEQAGSSISLFTERNVDRHLLGWEIPSSAFQSVNAVFIVMLAPLFSRLWAALGKWEPSIPVKFGWGILQLGLGFAALWFGATQAQSGSMVSVIWLILGYLLHTTGELCVSPVGLSAVTKLSPTQMTGYMLGIWFLASSAAQYVGALIAKTMSLPHGDPVEGASVMVYGSVFGQIALVSFVTALLVFALSPWMKRGMHGVE